MYVTYVPPILTCNTVLCCPTGKFEVRKCILTLKVLLDGDSLILLDVMKVVFTTCFILL